MSKTVSKQTNNVQNEGIKAGLKSIGKKVAKAAANEIIQELPGPPGHLARAIVSEVKKANKEAKQKALAKQILNTVKGSGDYTVMGELRGLRNRPTVGARVRGNGDYTVHSNSIAMHSRVAPDTDLVPSFKGHQRETRVMHREYLGDIISSPTSGAFQNTLYRINPGVVTSFPWLSVIAQNFDQWRPNGIVVCFKSTSSIYNGSSQALGTVIIASDYDLTDAPYSSKIEMENSEFAVSAKSSDNILHPIECAIGERQVKILKCRGVSNPSDNLQWYDLCNLQVATQGITGSSVNLGELWITYDISFFKEQLYGNLFGNSILQYNYEWSTGTSTSAYFGNSGAANPTNTLNLTLTGTTITFPANVSAGTYFLEWGVLGDSTAFTMPTFTPTSGCIVGPAIFGANSRWYAAQTGTSAVMLFNMMVTVTAPSAVITLSGGTIVTNSIIGHLNLIQTNSNIV